MLWAAHAGEIELRRADGATRLRGRFPYGKAAVLSDGGRTGRPQKEVIEPRAFSYRVEDPDEDIHLLVSHDFDHPLASKRTRTLTLRDSTEALTFEAVITPPIAATTHARDALAMIEAGLFVGLSPGFRLPPTRAVPDAEWIEEEADEGEGSDRRGAIVRHVRQALLYELSIVTRPAYSEAQVQLRNWAPDGQRVPASGLRRVLRRWRA